MGRILWALAWLAATYPGVALSQTCQFGPDQCQQGFVWRDGSPQDHVCVLPPVRAQTVADNAQAPSRVNPNGAFGSDSCVQGFVWREAFQGDHVCVTGDVRAQAQQDNAQASARRDRACAFDTRSIEVHSNAPKPPNPVPPRGSASVLKIQPDGSIVGVSQAPLTGLTDKMWLPGQTLTVLLNGGNAEIRSKVRRFASEWMQYANIKFVFVASDPAVIRVDINKNGEFYSSIGRDALGVPGPFKTMNLGFRSDSPPDDEIRRHTLHEFGHALGLVHEHQSPAAGIPWNKEKVYQFYHDNEDPPWDKAKVDDNILNNLDAATTNYSTFDPQSIMLYWFPAALTLNGIGMNQNNDLSDTDKRFIRMWYPFPGDSSGQIHTGDDCDEVNFTAEYGVGSPDTVTFGLRESRPVTFWKAFSVPTGGDGWTELGVQDLSTADQEIAVNDIDSSRQLRFGKGKAFNVHTWLPFTWDVLPALPGGSRLIMTWIRDRCG